LECRFFSVQAEAYLLLLTLFVFRAKKMFFPGEKTDYSIGMNFFPWLLYLTKGKLPTSGSQVFLMNSGQLW
jgi:hypothetical protein